MTSEGWGEIFEGDSADTCGRKFPLTLMGGRAEGLACADPGARTPISASGMFTIIRNTKYLRNILSKILINSPPIQLRFALLIFVIFAILTEFMIFPEC